MGHSYIVTLKNQRVNDLPLVTTMVIPPHKFWDTTGYNPCLTMVLWLYIHVQLDDITIPNEKAMDPMIF